jgi:NAD(P)-dependent dehydrogenase (short-subunit alcohol dehydrogenase family)
MLKKGGGTIVTVSTSALSNTPAKGFAAYLAAKGALRAFTASIAAEYRSRGIRVFSVAPGFMATPLTQSWHAAFREAALRSSVAADPATVARSIRKLVEDTTLPAGGESYDV